MTLPRPTQRSELGGLLAYWRKTKQLSQLALASEAEISPRHLCFLETGRAQPSREMILRLASVLDVPLRARNGLLLAGGFAPVFAESDLDAPELAAVRWALDAMLAQQEPYPAVVMNRAWDVLATNLAAERFFALMLDGRRPPAPANVLRMMFHPQGLRPSVIGWPEVGATLITRAHREAVGGVPDESLRGVLDEIMHYEGVPKSWRSHDPGSRTLPVLPITFQIDEREFRFFSTVTTLGTPQDVTVQEVRLECFFPVDETTRAHALALARNGK
jgi:transcriptional regulator with XRE-family HTH domain